MNDEDLSRMYQLLEEMKKIVAKNDPKWISRHMPIKNDPPLKTQAQGMGDPSFNLVYRPPGTQAEYGSLGNVGFANMTSHMYDSEGKEVEDPKCKKCGKEMSPVIGKEAMAWYCFEHGFNQMTDQDILDLRPDEI